MTEQELEQIIAQEIVKTLHSWREGPHYQPTLWFPLNELLEGIEKPLARQILELICTNMRSAGDR